jgi:hypothetical protein
MVKVVVHISLLTFHSVALDAFSDDVCQHFRSSCFFGSDCYGCLLNPSVPVSSYSSMDLSLEERMNCCVCGYLHDDPLQQWRVCECPAHVSYLLTSAGACVEHMCSVSKVSWCFRCMQFDPTGFLRVFALLGDTELAQAHHHHFDPTEGLGHPVRGSSDYCMADDQMACGWAEDWMIN